jgi:hypothetical protein
MKVDSYFVHNAEILEDGTLRVGTCGTEGDCLCTGVYDVPPDSLDYKFWLWLKQRVQPRWYQFGPVSGLNEQAIAEYRLEYEREQSNKPHRQPPAQ